MIGQISITDYLKTVKSVIWGGCGDCICRNCLWYASGRCPYGECFDDKRATDTPYDKTHPDKSPRTQWSNWNKPGEQAHWCRGGTNYPIRFCERFKKYAGCQVKNCLEAVVCIYQDGYIECSLVDTVGCEECYRRLEEKGEYNEE